MIKLSPKEQTHVNFMKKITLAVNDSPMVLKGGTALLLTRGLDRFSEDLDFDSSISLSLDKRISQSALKAGVILDSIKLKKSTDSVKRYIVNYHDKNGSPNRLKIETKLFSSLDDENIEMVGGIKTYKVKTLINQKIEASENRSKVRDLYDLNFLSKNYVKSFDKGLSDRLNAWAKNPDALVSQYKKNFENDSILNNKDLEVLALEMNDNALKIQVRLIKKDKLIKKVKEKVREYKSKKVETKKGENKDSGIER